MTGVCKAPGPEYFQDQSSGCQPLTFEGPPSKPPSGAGRPSVTALQALNPTERQAHLCKGCLEPPDRPAASPASRPVPHSRPPFSSSMPSPDLQVSPRLVASFHHMAAGFQMEAEPEGAPHVAAGRDLVGWWSRVCTETRSHRAHSGFYESVLPWLRSSCSVSALWIPKGTEFKFTDWNPSPGSVFILGSHPEVLRTSSWLCAQESLTEGLRETYGVPGIEPGSVVCRARTHMCYLYGPQVPGFQVLEKLTRN